MGRRCTRATLLTPSTTVSVSRISAVTPVARVANHSALPEVAAIVISGAPGGDRARRRATRGRGRVAGLRERAVGRAVTVGGVNSNGDGERDRAREHPAVDARGERERAVSGLSAVAWHHTDECRRRREDTGKSSVRRGLERRELSLTRAARRGGRSAGELGRAPRRPQAPLDLLAELIDGDALLGQRIAVAQGHRAVLERLVVDRHRPRRADLVLAAVAAADRPALVVLGLHALAQGPVDLARQLG